MSKKPSRSEQILKLAGVSPGIETSQAAEILGMSKKSIEVYASNLRKEGKLKRTRRTTRGTLELADRTPGVVEVASTAEQKPETSKRQGLSDEDLERLRPLVHEGSSRAERYRQEGVLTNILVIRKADGEILVRGMLGSGALLCVMIGQRAREELENPAFQAGATRLVEMLGDGSGQDAVLYNLTDLGGGDEDQTALVCAWFGGRRVMCRQAPIGEHPLTSGAIWKDLSDEQAAKIYDLGVERAELEDSEDGVSGTTMRDVEPSDGTRSLRALSAVMSDPQRAPVMTVSARFGDGGMEIGLATMRPEVITAVSEATSSGGFSSDPEPRAPADGATGSADQEVDPDLGSLILQACAQVEDERLSGSLVNFIVVGMDDGSTIVMEVDGGQFLSMMTGAMGDPTDGLIASMSQGRGRSAVFVSMMDLPADGIDLALLSAWSPGNRMMAALVAPIGDQPLNDPLAGWVPLSSEDLRSLGVHGTETFDETDEPRGAETEVTEKLTCAFDGHEFERVRTRGRKPKYCHEHKHHSSPSSGGAAASPEGDYDRDRGGATHSPDFAAATPPSEAMTAGQALYELGKLFEEIGRYKENRELDEKQLKDRYLDSITKLREVVNQKLVGYQGTGIKRKKDPKIPPGPSLRRNLQHQVDLDPVAPATNGSANVAWNGGVVPDYWVAFPRKELVHLPHFFIQTRGAEGNSEQGWVAQKADFKFGLSSYQFKTFADAAGKSALVDYMFTDGENFLDSREVLADGGKGIHLNQRQNVEVVAGKDALSLQLSDIEDKQELVEWARGAEDWGIQGSLSLDEVREMSDSELLDRVWEVWRIASKPARRVFELTRRSPSPSVFISYRRKDFGGGEEDAKPYLSELEGAIRSELEGTIKEGLGSGVEVFWDNHLSRDGNYNIDLLNQVRDAWLMIVLMGDKYFDADRWPNAEDFCRKEYDMAVDKKVDIWCVSVNGTKPPGKDLEHSLGLKPGINVDVELSMTLDQAFPENAATVAVAVAGHFENLLRTKAPSGS